MTPAFVGCSRGTVKVPPTNTVEGTVLRKDGKPFPGGFVEFRNVEKPEIVTLGEINDNGQFTLRTLGDSTQNVEGVPEGEYDVTVTPKLNEKGETEPIELTKRYKISKGDTTITVTLEK